VTKEFVQQRDGSFYLIGSRVPLALIVQEFQRGESAETIRAHYPTLSLEQVYGAITFYLGHQADVDQDLARRNRDERQFVSAHPAPPELKAKLERARRHTPSHQS
jgi:uncharacterized protein (DUF433 family)